MKEQEVVLMTNTVKQQGLWKIMRRLVSTFLSHLLNMYCIVLFKLNSGQHWKMHVWHIQGFCSKQVFISSINHTDTTHFHYNALSCQGKLQ